MAQWDYWSTGAADIEQCHSLSLCTQQQSVGSKLRLVTSHRASPNPLRDSVYSPQWATASANLAESQSLLFASRSAVVVFAQGGDMLQSMLALRRPDQPIRAVEKARPRTGAGDARSAKAKQPQPKESAKVKAEKGADLHLSGANRVTFL